MRARWVTLSGLVLLSLAMPAAAQTPTLDAQTPPPRRPATVRAPRAVPVGARVFFALDSDTMTASKTFDAILGSSTLAAYGGGGEVLNIWRRVFVRGALTFVSKDGTRVQPSGGEFIPIGIPLTVTMRPFELGGGWRFGKSERDRVIPYVGGGLLLVGLKQKSTVPTETAESTSDSFTGTVLFGGVDLMPAGKFMAGAEVQFRSVPNAIGDDTTTSKERNLGGFTLRALVGLRIR